MTTQLFGQSKETFATGLQGPQKISRTADGRFLVSEAGAGTNQGRVSMISATGMVTALIEGLPAGEDAQGDISGATGATLYGSTIYVLTGEGSGQRSIEGVSLPNPDGAASPLHSALLAFELDTPFEQVMSGFTLTLEDHWRLADGFPIELTNADGVTATVHVVTDFPDTMPDANIPYRFSNPFGITMSPEHEGVAFITDASVDALVRVDLETGRSQRMVRFPKIPNEAPFGPPVSDYVPTSAVPYAGGLLVSNLAGFPFSAGTAAVRYVDLESGESHVFIANLSSALDVAVVEGEAGPRFYTLEFSTAFLEGGPGRLMSYDTPEGQSVVDDLVTPTSMAVDPDTGDIYITELATGMVVRVTPN